jgi:hypothetical protein
LVGEIDVDGAFDVVGFVVECTHNDEDDGVVSNVEER